MCSSEHRIDGGGSSLFAGSATRSSSEARASTLTSAPPRPPGPFIRTCVAVGGSDDVVATAVEPLVELSGACPRWKAPARPRTSAAAGFAMMPRASPAPFLLRAFILLLSRRASISCERRTNPLKSVAGGVGRSRTKPVSTDADDDVSADAAGKLHRSTTQKQSDAPSNVIATALSSPSVSSTANARFGKQGANAVPFAPESFSWALGAAPRVSAPQLLEIQLPAPPTKPGAGSMESSVSRPPARKDASPSAARANGDA
mmetsp:Transcript_9457/g.25406  ORF Transcript_9457/g.25406 Transcript_9457/m.25406 type:complete len:259 (+) Transcript_9457:137-913(+)